MNAAVIITLSRIVFAALILFLRPFSLPFWLVYLCGGISDLLDNFQRFAFCRRLSLLRRRARHNTQRKNARA